MKVGIDARMFGPRVGGGGLGRYVEQLVNHLEGADRQTRYVLWLLKSNLEAPRVPSARFEKRLADIRWYTLREQLLLAPRMDHARCDLLHFPHWNVPLGIRTPFIVTIHDTILLDEPRSARATTLGPLAYAAKYAAYRRVLAHAVRASRAIIAVSSFTRRCILSHFPEIDPAKVTVVYEGVTDLPSSHTNSQIPTPKSPYFLHVGNSYPHKNLPLLLRALTMLRKKHPDVTLVLAGAEDVFSRRLENEAQALGLRDAVRFVPSPDDEAVAALYRFARGYVFPSRAEGFGLPGLEAMCAGVPVAAAQAGSLPEVYGDAALYFEPHDAAGMAEAMGTLLTDERVRRRLREHGRERARRYSWRRAAEETRRVYERAMKT